MTEPRASGRPDLVGPEETAMRDDRVVVADPPTRPLAPHDAGAPRPTSTDAIARAANGATAPQEPAATRPGGNGQAASHAPAADLRLFDNGEAGELRDRWVQVQGAFVDEPRKAVEEADALVADVMTRLAEGFAQRRSGLEGQWSRGDSVSTEDLRLTLQRYRAFFERLLSL